MPPALNMIGLVVANMGRSLAFYRRLGLDIPAAADDQPHVEVKLPGGLRLGWDTIDTIRSFDPDWTPPTGGSAQISLAFACGSAAEVDQLYNQLVEAGCVGNKPPWDAFWGQRYAVVQDPDGNGIDLYAPLSVDEHTE
ncbi:MAG TPA: VOC family protein [Micromonosporaceae bacterium]|nr:VOC family protein [Micromonosporaceae bacterium]